MKTNNPNVITEWKNLNPADYAPFIYPLEVEEYKEKYGEDSMLLQKEWFPGEQGAHIEAYGKDALTLFRLFGEHYEREGWDFRKCCFKADNGVVRFSVSRNEVAALVKIVNEQNLSCTYN